MTLKIKVNGNEKQIGMVAALVIDSLVWAEIAFSQDDSHVKWVGDACQKM